MASWGARGKQLGGGVSLQHVQGDEFERPLMGGRQSDRSGIAGVDAFEPTRGADAPTVAGPETRKIIVGRGRGEVVAGGATEDEKLGRHFHAERVTSLVARTGVAVAVAEETREWGRGARFERTAEDIAGGQREHVRKVSGCASRCNVGLVIRGRPATTPRCHLRV